MRISGASFDGRNPVLHDFHLRIKLFRDLTASAPASELTGSLFGAAERPDVSLGVVVMPINSVVYPDRRLIVTTGSGVVTDGELLAHWHSGYSDELSPWGTPEFLDLRAVGRFEATSAGLWRLVVLDTNFAKQRSAPFQFAIVAPSDHIFGMMRIYQSYSDVEQSYSEVKRNFVHVFRDLSGVEEWLDTPLPAA